MDLKEIEVLGEDINTHWYYSSKSRALLKIIKNIPVCKVMDVGAGSGYFSRVLLNKTDTQEAMCIDISYEKEETAKENGKPIHFLRGIEKDDADLVLLMDVLEHVDDDIGLLSEYVSKVPVGTKFVISVPAFNWLWSPHDDFLEHKRRYTLGQVESVINRSGLKINHSCYYFSLVLPFAIITRFIGKILSKNNNPHSQLKKHSFIVNSLLKTLCTIDRLFLMKNKIAGLTVFCYAEKR